MENKTPTLNNWLTVFAISISAIALIISAWQAFMFRTHNELTVTPLLDAEIQIVEDKLYPLVWITLNNNGFGPAIIESNTVSYKNKALDSGLFYTEYVSNLYSVYEGTLYLLQKGSAIKNGESKKIMVFDKAATMLMVENDATTIDAYRRFLSIEIKVVYRSLYGNKSTYSKKIGELLPGLSKSLDWNPDWN